MQRSVSPNCLQAGPVVPGRDLGESHALCTSCGCPCHDTTRAPAGFKATFEQARREAEEKRAAELDAVRAEWGGESA